MTGISPAAVGAFLEEQLGLLRARPAIQPAFTAQEYADRHRRLRTAMAAEDLELLIVSSPEAMCWLHGFQSRWYKTQTSTEWPPIQCTLVHVDDDRLLFLDSIEHEHLIHARSIAQELRLFPYEGMEAAVAFLMGVLRAEGWTGAATGIEAWSPTPNRAVSEVVEAALVAEGARVRDASLLLRAARRIKSPAEIALLEEAALICDAGLLGLRDAMRPGLTELEGWGALVSAMAAAGGEPAALHELVHFGPVEMGHEISSRRVLRPGDYVFADPCGVVNRYHANVALPLVLGEPDPRAVALADVLGGAYAVLCSVAKAGTPIRDVNAALREYYRDTGVWGRHAWIGGYELGIAFPPDWVGQWLFTVDEDDPEGVIEAGTVTNFESCAGFGMIDTVVFETDAARTLSRLPHELLVAPLA